MGSNEANKKNIVYWEKWYKDHPLNREDIVFDDWMWTFNEIIEEARGPVVDLGCGEGNDTLYMLNRGKKVCPCDGSMNAIMDIKKNFPEVAERAKCFDFLDEFPFTNSETDLVVADLSLHYFTREDTIKILNEIKRILTNKGHMFVRVNALDDVNHGAGQGIEVEPHLYMTEDGRYKRFFSNSDVYDFFNIFDIKQIRKEPMKRYKLEKSTYIIAARNRK